MSIPLFAPFPDASVRERILPREWSLYVQSWETLAELYLRLQDREFEAALKESGSLADFLVSFFREVTQDPNLAPETATLRKRCFFLLHRIWSGWTIPEKLLSWTFLSDVCHAYPKSEKLRQLLKTSWKRSEPVIEENLQEAKTTLLKLLESKKPEDVEPTLNRLGPLLKVAPEAGIYMLTGSDFLDALTSAYPKTSANVQKKLATTAYLGLTALLQGEKPNYSLLSDHLYSLKTSAEPTRGQNTLLADLVTNTPLLNKIRDATDAGASRLKNTAASLSGYNLSSMARPKKIVRRRVDKGKGKVNEDEFGHGALGELHVHRMSLITQIQDLFPDLGSAFVVKLLDEYNHNPEEVIGHLLEDNLPPRLANADRSEQLPTSPATQKPRFSPRPTPPLSPPPQTTTYQRRNVFDNDEFDRLAVDTSRLHIGRKNADLTADQVLADRSTAPHKSAILSALSAFDLDDDERDDTYDVEDVGGLVDSTMPDGEEADKNEEALFRAYSMSPDAFGRDADTRRGKARAALKSETGMTDEAIEGWGIMVGREPKRLRRLEAKFSTFSGQQRELASTSYRATPADSGEEAGGQSQRGERGGGLSGRGRGRGRGGRGGGRGGRGGGNVAGPSDDKATQQARQRKDQNKASAANHNRKGQRAKKLARGGFPPAG